MENKIKKAFMPLMAAGIQGLQSMLHAVVNTPSLARPGRLPIEWSPQSATPSLSGRFDSVCQACIRWLSEQHIYPKAYWQCRNSNRVSLIIGQVRVFDDLEAVARYLNEVAPPNSGLSVAAMSESGFPGVWGLNAFAPVAVNGASRSHYWFLPRFEITFKDDKACFRCNLASDSNLHDDALDALMALEAWTPECPEALSALPQVTGKTMKPGRDEWAELIGQALAAIKSGALEKVVLARQTTLQLAEALPPEVLLAASQRVNRHCYHFMMALNAEHAFVGATPERLYRRDGQVLTTEALAGTVANADDDAEAQRLADWLAHDEKNLFENQLVVDDIKARLADIVSNITISPLRIVRLRRVQHLQRSIHARLTNADDALCVQRLQPTAAVAGLPRAAARQFIDAHEPFARGWYAGSVGYCSANEAEFAVTLRSALIEGKQVRLCAGCGIVAASDAAEEWEELDRKTEALGSLFQMTEDR